MFYSFGWILTSPPIIKGGGKSSVKDIEERVILCTLIRALEMGFPRIHILSNALEDIKVLNGGSDWMIKIISNHIFYVISKLEYVDFSLHRVLLRKCYTNKPPETQAFLLEK